LLTGSLVVEQVFGLPGRGSLFRARCDQSVTTRWSWAWSSFMPG
jgi:ABC-type dipeptide/oligopeptide/nickel transport system permease component